MPERWFIRLPSPCAMMYKVAGIKVARAIVLAAAINIVMAGLFWLVGRMTIAPNTELQAEFIVLSPVWLIVLRFQSLDKLSVRSWLTRTSYRLWVERLLIALPVGALSFNAISVPPDSLAFVAGVRRRSIDGCGLVNLP